MIDFNTQMVFAIIGALTTAGIMFLVLIFVMAKFNIKRKLLQSILNTKFYKIGFVNSSEEKIFLFNKNDPSGEITIDKQKTKLSEYTFSITVKRDKII